MKAWKNEAGNWCFEFERDEQEAMRFIAIVSAGVRNYKENREKFPIGFINATLFYRAISCIFVGSNYTGNFGTIEKPLVHRAKEMAESILKYKDKNQAYWTESMRAGLNDRELQILEDNVGDIRNIL